jgi:predicted CXXCH cytochrome family protein
MMKTSSMTKYLLPIFFAAFAVIATGASYSPTAIGTAIISEKESDIHNYHFKDTAYDCGTCHTDMARNGFRTSRMDSVACYKCHERLDNTEWVHGPVGVGQCAVCHDPHGSVKPMFLTRRGEGLCIYCHDAGRTMKHAESVSSRKCIACHDPHGGEDTSMLRRQFTKKTPAAY